MPDWSRVSARDVERAIERVRRDGVPQRRAARHTRLLSGGEELPAKYVLGVAWEIATGQQLDPEDFTGGHITAEVLARLGFEVKYKQKLYRSAADLASAKTSPAPATKARMTPRESPAPAAPPRRVDKSGGLYETQQSRSSGRATPSRGQGMYAVGVAIRGAVSSGRAENHRREAQLAEVVQGLLTHDPRRTAALVVLPGGYFQLEQDVGALSIDERLEELDAAPFAATCRSAAAALEERLAGARLVVGVDSSGGDQLCVAWSSKGVVGAGRKVFPTKHEAANGLVVNLDDYGDARRVFALPGGRRAVLCACYDGFGISNPELRTRPIRHLRVGRMILAPRSREFHEYLRSGVSSWRQLLEGVDVAAIAIHGFDTGTASMWQRHGIATASAALAGGSAIAGAHFAKLPSAPAIQTLASVEVPSAHLNAGRKRGAAAQVPEASLAMHGVLIRWYSLRPPSVDGAPADSI